jgi:TatD DNase family protein
VIEYFDSHCHLTDAAFRDDREAVLVRATEAGVTRLVTISSNVADARAALALAQGRAGVWCTAGVHPHEAGTAAPGDMDEVRRLALEHDEVVALGETGLDFHYDHAPRGVQRELFDAHLALGAECGLPVVVHAREADDDVAAALRAMPSGTLGVLHCFTGGAKAFAEAMAAGWYVSFSGIASFKSFSAADALAAVPEDRLLVETDAPYLAPVPMRGRRNEPAFVSHVVEALAR